MKKKVSKTLVLDTPQKTRPSLQPEAKSTKNETLALEVLTFFFLQHLCSENAITGPKVLFSEKELPRKSVHRSAARITKMKILTPTEGGSMKNENP